MKTDIPQFGNVLTEYTNRPGAYVIVLNDEGKLLVLKVGNTYYLPGGGIDGDEDPQATIEREIMEEAGCRIANLRALGQANQFFSRTSLGPLNKQGIFYQADLVSINPEDSTEPSHEVLWIKPETFLESNAGEFQKWAVRKILE